MAPSTSTAAQPGPSGQAGAAAAAADAQDHVTTLEDLVNFLLTEKDPSAKNSLLKNFATKETRDVLLASRLSNGEDPLNVLSVEENTLGCARLSSPGAPPQTDQLEGFCKNFKPEQARLASDRITSLAKGIVRASGENLKLALSPLRNLVTRYPPSLNHLTNLHPMFLNLCVITRHFTAAIPVITFPIFHVDTTLSELHYNDNLLYHYAGGIVFGVLKRWKEAEEFFEIVVTSPAQVPAAIQFEALKKLTLVQLILYGKPNQPPKYTNATLIRLIKNTPYNTLARAYPQTIPVLNTTIAKDIDSFKADQNYSLVQQVIDRAPRWLIKKLTSTYLTLGLTDIGAQVGLSTEDARSVVFSMVEAGDINASISVDDTVTFVDSTPHFTKVDVDSALLLAQEQSKRLYDLERQLNSSKEYLAKALKHKDEAWGVDDDVSYNHHSGGPSGPWAEESMYST